MKGESRRTRNIIPSPPPLSPIHHKYIGWEREADDVARKEDAPLDWEHKSHDAGIHAEDVACVACVSVVEKTLRMDR